MAHRTCDVAVHQSSQLTISTDAQRLKRLLGIASSFARYGKHLLIAQAGKILKMIDPIKYHMMNHQDSAMLAATLAAKHAADFAHKRHPRHAAIGR